MLSVDIGFKHMVCTFKNKQPEFHVCCFEVEEDQPFQNMIRQFIENLDRILELLTLEEIDIVIIE